MAHAQDQRQNRRPAESRRADGRGEELPLGEGIARYLRSCRRAQMAEATLNHKRTTLERFAKTLPAGVTTRSVEATDVRRFIDDIEGRGASLHWLRHTFASWITNDMHWPPKVAQQALGHQKLSTTASYVHVHESAQQDAITSSMKAHGIEYSGSAPEATQSVADWLALAGAFAQPQQPQPQNVGTI